MRIYPAIPAIMVLAAFSGVKVAEGQRASRDVSHAYVISPLKLDTLLPGVSLDVVLLESADPMEAFEYIRASQGGRSFVLKSLNDLRGLVHIPDARSALSFVRLRTSAATWYLWKSGPSHVEIVDSHDLPSITSYGMKHHHSKVYSQETPAIYHKRRMYVRWESEPPYRTMNLVGQLATRTDVPSSILTNNARANYDLLGDGMLGILSGRAFHKSGFTHPEVIEQPRGFTIRRWIFVPKGTDDGHVERIEEWVGRDGEYSRKRLESRQIPDIHIARLWILSFK